MMNADDFLITPENFRDYLATQNLVDDPQGCVVRELGGGVSNVVLLIEWPEHLERRWVAKQSLEKLRVQDDWRSDRARIFREADAIHMLRPILGQALPEVMHVDRENYVYIMTAAPPSSLPWKESLFAIRRSDVSVAREVGLLLARLINSTAAKPKFGLWFDDRTVFDQLRIDPYYRTTAARQERNSEVQTALRDLVVDSLKIRTSLVHGDFSPKNILVRGRDIFLIDFEVVHWGDPSFDAGFLLNHLFLKAFHRPQFGTIYGDVAREFWNVLIAGIGPGGTGDFEIMTIRHLGGLMLARIDGKSPVEYICDQETKARVRQTAKSILLDPPASMTALIDWISGEF